MSDLNNLIIPGGYILLSRKLIESNIWNKPPLYIKVWIWLLINAQHQEYKGLKRGCYKTSIPDIINAMSYKSGYRTIKPSKKEVWGILEYLRNPYGRNHGGTTEGTMVETTRVTQGFVYKIVNYDFYQTPLNYGGNNEGNNGRTAEEQREGQKGNNNNNNVNNEISNNVISTTTEENEVLKILQQIPGWPYDLQKDIEHIRELSLVYSSINIIQEVKKFRVWLKDNPLKKKSNPRLQLYNWCKKATEYQKKERSKDNEYNNRNESRQLSDAAKRFYSQGIG